MNHTTTVLSSQGYKKKVLIIGGITDNFKLNDRIHFLKIIDKRRWWVLHYLLITDIRQMIGRNMCQEIVEILLLE